MTHHFYLSREDQGRLTVVLQGIPELAEDLAAAIAKPYEAIDYQPRVSTGDRPAPLPYDPTPEMASQYLTRELRRWVDWLANTRRLTRPEDYPTPMSRWLINNMNTLATTPGSEPAYADISTEIRAAKRATGRPARATPNIDTTKLEAARTQELNASGIAALATEIGINGLTRTRVNNLRALGHITPIRVIPNGKKTIPVYRLGDVLDAHHTTQQRTTA